MSWSVMYANVSMSVTPGSDTLWSVHSGQRCCTSRLASSTRSWKRRSSRFGTGSAIVSSSLAGDHVEREHEVVLAVGGLEPVVDVDVEDRLVVGRLEHVDLLDVHAVLPHRHGPRDLGRDRRGGHRVRRGEHEVVDAAAELGPHRALARARRDDEPDRLGDLALPPDQGDAAVRVGADREGPATADEVGHQLMATFVPLIVVLPPDAAMSTPDWPLML